MSKIDNGLVSSRFKRRSVFAGTEAGRLVGLIAPEMACLAWICIHVSSMPIVLKRISHKMSRGFIYVGTVVFLVVGFRTGVSQIMSSFSSQSLVHLKSSF